MKQKIAILYLSDTYEFILDLQSGLISRITKRADSDSDFSREVLYEEIPDGVKRKLNKHLKDCDLYEES